MVTVSCVIPPDLLPLSTLCDQYPLLKSIFESLFCIPASFAPVERVFSKSGLLMRPHRARMSDDTMEMLMFLACNSGIQTADDAWDIYILIMTSI